MPLTLPRRTLDLWHSDALGQQANLNTEALDAADQPSSYGSPTAGSATPPPQYAPEPPPAPAPAQQPVQQPAQSPSTPAAIQAGQDLSNWWGQLTSGAQAAPAQAASAVGGAASGVASAVGGGASAVGTAARATADQGGDFWNQLTSSAGLAPSPSPVQPVATTPPVPSDTLTNPLQQQQPTATPNVDTHQSQFTMGLTDAEAQAACGPAAAIGFARKMGRNPTSAEAMSLAQQVGWSAGQGMAGISSEQKLLQSMGVQTRIESGPTLSWDHITRDAQNGNPVILDTPGHYLYVDDARVSPTGVVEYHVGSQGTDLHEGGSAWMTRASIEAHPIMGGPVRGALFSDSPNSPYPSVAGTTHAEGAPVTGVQTTAGLSGGGALSGKIGDTGKSIMAQGAAAASWLGVEGQKALQSVLVTEGGLAGARGDGGKSAGPLQFYEGGELANFAKQMGMGLDAAKTWVEAHPVEAIQWAIGTATNPGYLGAVIAQGAAQGLTGAALATYAQRHAQVSVSPERAGDNYNAMFGDGSGPLVSSQQQSSSQQSSLQPSQPTGPSPLDISRNLADQGQQLIDSSTARLAQFQKDTQARVEKLDQDTKQRKADLDKALNDYTTKSDADYAARAAARQQQSAEPTQQAASVPAAGAAPGGLEQAGQQIAQAFTGLFQHFLGGGPSGQTAAMQPTPSDNLTNPLGGGNSLEQQTSPAGIQGPQGHFPSVPREQPPASSAPGLIDTLTSSEPARALESVVREHGQDVLDAAASPLDTLGAVAQKAADVADLRARTPEQEELLAGTRDASLGPIPVDPRIAAAKEILLDNPWGLGVAGSRQGAGEEVLTAQDPEYAALKQEDQALRAKMRGNLGTMTPAEQVSARADQALSPADTTRLLQLQKQMQDIRDNHDLQALAKQHPDIQNIEKEAQGGQGALAAALMPAGLMEGAAGKALFAAANLVDPANAPLNLAGEGLGLLRGAPRPEVPDAFNWRDVQNAGQVFSEPLSRDARGLMSLPSRIGQAVSDVRLGQGADVLDQGAEAAAPRIDHARGLLEDAASRLQQQLDALPEDTPFAVRDELQQQVRDAWRSSDRAARLNPPPDYGPLQPPPAEAPQRLGSRMLELLRGRQGGQVATGAAERAPNLVPDAATAADLASKPYNADTLMQAYEAVTPARVASIRGRVMDHLLPRIAGKRGDSSAARDLIDQTWEAGKQLLETSRVTATGMSEKSAAALADGAQFTNKLNMAGVAEDSARATRRQVGPSRVTPSAARDFVKREAHADHMALGSTQALDENGVRDPDALNRVYAYTTAGPPLIGPNKPVVWLAWEDDAPRVVTAHHHYGLGSPDADIHRTSTPPGLKSLMWDPLATVGEHVLTTTGKLLQNWRDAGMDVGGGRRVAASDALVGPSGESDMRMATVLAAMPADLVGRIKRGEITDPTELAAVLLREAVPQSSPGLAAAKKALRLPKGGVTQDLKDAMALGGQDNGIRTESLMVDPQLERVKAVYMVGTPADLNKKMANSGGRTRLQLAQDIRQRILDETGKDVPILFKDVTPDVADGVASMPSKSINDVKTLAGPAGVQLAPGRQAIRDAYTRAGYRDIGGVRPTMATDVAGAALGGYAGNESTPEDASPLERAGRIAGGAALGGTAAHAAVGAGLRLAEEGPPRLDALRARQRGAIAVDELPERYTSDALGGRPSSTGPLADVSEGGSADAALTAAAPFRQEGETWKAATLRNLRDTGLAPAEDVGKALLGEGPTDSPEYLQGVVQFLGEQRQKIMAGELTPRDVIKAYLGTMSSIRAKAAGAATVSKRAANAGFEIGEGAISKIGGKASVRPEDAFAQWMLTPEGKSALDALESGDLSPAQVGGAIDRFRGKVAEGGMGFGQPMMDPQMLTGAATKGAYNLTNIAELTDKLNEAGKAGDVEGALRVAGQMKGIGTAKEGFIAHLLGLGDAPTVDTNELKIWLDQASPELQQRAERAFGTKGSPAAVEMRNQLMQRFDELRAQGYGTDIPPEAFQHVMHHWLFDRALNAETTHKVLYEAQQRAHIRPTMATDLASAALGGYAANETTPEDASPLERGARVLGGAALAGTAGHVGMDAALRAAARGRAPGEGAAAISDLVGGAGRQLGQVATGAEDASPIEHDASVMFPDALDKLRNAVSGRQGGAASAELAASLGGGAAGAAAGYNLPEDDNAPAWERPARAAAGALFGATAPAAVMRGRIGEFGSGALQRSIRTQRGAEEAAAAAERAKAAAATAALPRTKQSTANDIVDGVVTYTTQNMLSGLGTATQNTLGGLSQTLARPAANLMGGRPVDAARDVIMMGRSLGDALSAYGNAMRTGIGATSPHEARIWGGKFGTPATAILRNLTATDELFRTLNGAGAAAAEASKRLRQNPGMDMAALLAKHEGDIYEAGKQGGREAVYAEGGGPLGRWGELTAEARTKLLHSNDPSAKALGGVMQWLLPMTSMPGRILGKGLSITPGGAELTTAAQLVKAGVTKDPELAYRAVRRNAIAEAVNYSLLGEAVQGNITGDGPTNPDAKAKLMEAVDDQGNPVWRPNSIRVGGRWMDYSGLGHVAIPMAMIANAVEASNEWAAKPADKRGAMPELAGDIAAATGRTVSNAWYMRNLGDVLDAMKTGNLKRVGQSLVTMGDRIVPMGGAVNEVRRMTDPYVREPDSIGERLQNRIPGLSRNVPPRLTATTGRPQEDPRDLLSTLGRGTAPNSMTPNPLAIEIARLDQAGAHVSAPLATNQYKGGQQTREQTGLIQQTLGQATNLYALNVMTNPAYAKATDHQKAAALTQAIRQSQSVADIDLGARVARSPHEEALTQWAQTPQYVGVKGEPADVQRQNFDIAEAHAKLTAYEATYGPRGLARLRKDDPDAFRKSQTPRLPSEILDVRKKALDKLLGGTLLEAQDKPETAGLVGISSTILPPP